MIIINGKNVEVKIFTDLLEDTAREQIQNMANHEITKGTQVRIMSDVHAGKGSTIGTTIKLAENFADWKICPNVVGVDVGCFTGDTKVKLADGRELSFLELIEEDKQGLENYCYSIEDGDVKISKIDSPREIEQVNEIYQITLDNGEIIKATGDHLFHLRDGTKARADELKADFSLMPLYINKAVEVQEELNVNVKRKIKVFNQYEVIYNPIENEYKLSHHLSDEYNVRRGIEDVNKEYYDEDKKGFVRHHIDFNKYNNNPSNIIRMGYLEHWKYHSDMIKHTNEMGMTGFKRASELDPDFYSKGGKAKAEATWRGPNSKKNYEDKRKLMESMNENGVVNSPQQRENSRQRQLTNNTTKFRTQNKDPKFILKQHIGKYNKIIKKCIDKFGKVNEANWNELRTVAGKNAPKYQTAVNKLLEHEMSIDGLVLELNDNVVNHKVVSVEVINHDEDIPVYCLTNFEYGNFALASGVFVDNCGIYMYKIKPKGDKVDLEKLDRVINEKVPSGFNVHNKPQNEKFTNQTIDNLTINMPESTKTRVINSLGTLGGGNHFIELGKDETGDYWLSVHSGSRNLGVQVASTHQDIAIKELEKKEVNISEVVENLKKEGRHKEISDTIKILKANQVELSNEAKGLAYLEGELLKDYLVDMIVAQEYAHNSRKTMLDIIVKAMGFTVVDKFDSVHNFVEHDNYKNGIIRKGATSAKSGERLVIPLNMRDGSLICIGKGNKDWNESAPHGAGRMMSRSKANKEIKLTEFQAQMEGIYSSSVSEATLDEAPDAYKPAEVIIENIKDTVDIVHIVKPVYNFKAH